MYEGVTLIESKQFNAQNQYKNAKTQKIINRKHNSFHLFNQDT